MGEEVIWELIADGSSTIATIDEISAALDALIQQFAQVASAAADLSALDDSLSVVSSVAADATASVDGMTEAMASMSQQIADDTATISALNESITNLEAQISMLTVEESSASESTNLLASAMSTLGAIGSSVGEALQAAMGPLMMIVGAAGMAGAALFNMGMQGQKGEELLSAMAGASQSDIIALQQEALKLGVNMQEASSGFYEVESAGYSGAKAIQVFDAAMKLAEGGQAQAGDVMTGLTAIMHDYNIAADKATDTTDIMQQAVFRGKQSMQDFATSIGPLAASGQKAGETFQEVAAAEATMTQINPHVRQDTMQLAALFDSLDPKMGKVENTAKGLGLSFDDAHYSSLDLLGKLEYLAQISGGVTTPAFAKLTGGVRGATAAVDLLQGGASTFITNLNAMAHAGGSTEAAFKTWETTIPSALDHVGAAFSVLATRAMDAIGPKLVPIINQVANALVQFADFASQHLNILLPVLAGLAAILGGTIIVVIGGFIASLVATAGPVLAVVAGIGVLVGGIVALVTHSQQLAPLFKGVQGVLQQVGAFLASAFTPVWQQLVNTFNTQLVPAWRSVTVALQPIMPELQKLAQFLGIVVVGAILLVVTVVAGLISAFAGLLSGVVRIFGGIVQVIAGAFHIIAGFLAVLVDVFTGNFGKIGSDLKIMTDGWSMLFSGVWQIILGVFQAAIGAIIGFVSGLSSSVTGIFDSMGIRIMDPVNRAVQGIQGAFFGLIAQAGSWGSEIIGNIVSGIEAGIGAAVQAATNVAGAIAGALHHSEPDYGPLKGDSQWGAEFVQNLVSGMNSQQNQIKGAALAVASSMTLAVTAPQIQAPGGLAGASGGNQQHLALLQQILTTLQQINGKSGGGSNTAISMNNNINASNAINPQQLYNILQSIGGFGYESLQRGSAGL